MATIITLITLAAAVLNICLFFKLWGMCNNVRRFAYKLECKLDKDLGIESNGGQSEQPETTGTQDRYTLRV